MRDVSSKSLNDLTQIAVAQIRGRMKVRRVAYWRLFRVFDFVLGIETNWLPSSRNTPRGIRMFSSDEDLFDQITLLPKDRIQKESTMDDSSDLKRPLRFWAALLLNRC